MSLTPRDAVVAVEGSSVSVPRSFVEIRSVPPQEWTIVRETEGHGPPSQQSGYVVCPSCRHRAVLPFTPVAKLRCPRCTELFAIAWSEAYVLRR